MGWNLKVINPRDGNGSSGGSSENSDGDDSQRSGTTSTVIQIVGFIAAISAVLFGLVSDQLEIILSGMVLNHAVTTWYNKLPKWMPIVALIFSVSLFTYGLFHIGYEYPSHQDWHWYLSLAVTAVSAGLITHAGSIEIKKASPKYHGYISYLEAALCVIFGYTLLF